MNILLLGHRGQLGREFVKIFATRNDIMIDSYDLAELDVTNKGALIKLAKMKKYQIVLNCTAFNNVDLAEEQPDLAFRVNYFAVRNLVEAAQINNSLLVHYSTDYVFSDNEEKAHRIYDERKPLSQYGKSKKQGEDLLKELYDKYLLIRTSWVFGYGPNGFVSKLIKWSKSTKVIELIDNQISCPTYAYDLANATMCLINKGVIGTFHITNSAVSKLEWGKYILNKISWHGQVEGVNMEDLDLKAKRPKYSILDNEDYVIICNKQMPSWQDATDRFLLLLSSKNEQ